MTKFFKGRGFRHGLLVSWMVVSLVLGFVAHWQLRPLHSTIIHTMANTRWPRHPDQHIIHHQGCSRSSTHEARSGSSSLEASAGPRVAGVVKCNCSSAVQGAGASSIGISRLEHLSHSHGDTAQLYLHFEDAGVRPGSSTRTATERTSISNTRNSSNNSINAATAAGSAALLNSSFNSSSSSSGSSNSSNSSSGNSSSSRSSNSSSSSSSDLIAYISKLQAVSARAKNDPAYLQKLRDAAKQPINIAIMTNLAWPFPINTTNGCKVDGVPLDCRIHNGGTEDQLDKADALFYHVPTFAGQPRAKAFPTQLRVAMSLESSAYYPNLDNPRYMCHFDAEMTYRTCGQVTDWYGYGHGVNGHWLFDLFQADLIVPFEEKLHAIAYINSNCGALSGRADIMRALMRLGDKLKVPVHSLGACDRNTPWPPGSPTGGPGKVEVMRKYKFCVAMENSVRRDYTTEKIWEPLAAGCVPIYMGSSRTRHIVPDPNSFIMYDPSGKTGHASTPEQLNAVLHEIGSDKARYEAMMAWKHRKPEDQPNDVFRYLWSLRHTTMDCRRCQFLARHRVEPQPDYMTCLFNKEWMSATRQPYIPKEHVCPTPKTSTA